MTRDIRPGKRLSHRSKLCTVRYVGQVNGKEGTWLGVEWDDPLRGKHAGTFEGHEYFRLSVSGPWSHSEIPAAVYCPFHSVFQPLALLSHGIRKTPALLQVLSYRILRRTCLSSSQTCASFLRPTTLWDEPVSFITALKNKYSSKTPSSSLMSNAIIVGGKQVQEIGYDKISARQSRLGEIENVILDGERIAFAGVSKDEGAVELTELCPRVTHLDISRNLAESLDDVLELVGQFPKCRSLVLDGNRIGSSGLQRQAKFDQITSLSLDGMLLTLDELSQICSSFPKLTTLSAGSNRLSIGSKCHLPNTLEELTLSDNDFSDLQIVQEMTSSCTELRKLKLGSNRISSLNDNNPFQQSLTSLDLSSNAISEWTCIDILPNTIPSLQNLQILHNTIYTHISSMTGTRYTQPETSMLILARLPNLQTLNLSRITDKDRLQAETFYLFQIGKEISAAPRQEEAGVLARHPRYTVLCEEYGPPTIVRTGLGDPNALRSRLVTLKLHVRRDYEHIESLERGATAEKELVIILPKSMSVYAVLGHVGKRIGIPPMSLRLVWETGEQEVVPSKTHQRRGSIDWSDSDDEKSDHEPETVEREVELVPSTRPLGTVVETSEAWIRVERTPPDELEE